MQRLPMVRGFPRGFFDFFRLQLENDGAKNA